MSNTCSFKYIIFGDAGVGMSCLLDQFIDHKFNLQQEETVAGEEFGGR